MEITLDIEDLAEGIQDLTPLTNWELECLLEAMITRYDNLTDWDTVEAIKEYIDGDVPFEWRNHVICWKYG